jgi:hypothetical protein
MRLVNKTKISEMWGKHRTWASQITRSGKALYDSVHDGKIDVESHCYRSYCEGLGFTHTEDDRLVPLVKDIDEISKENLDDGSASGMDHILDMPLRSILNHFGEEAAFSAWLGDIKKAEDIREKRLKNQQTEGSLISREGVKSQLMGLLEELSRRLLLDGAKTITRRNYAAAHADVSIEDAEKETRANMSQNLRKAREGITRRLKKL